MKPGAVIGASILIVLGILSVARVYGNLRSEASPPVSCQLLGGSWSWWDGWQCGASSGTPATEPTCPTPQPGNVYPIWPSDCLIPSGYRNAGEDSSQYQGSEPDYGPAPPSPSAPATLPQGIPGSVLAGKGAVRRGNAYCLAGQPAAPGISGELENGAYVQLYGPGQGWFIDHDDPQNSPCAGRMP